MLYTNLPQDNYENLTRDDFSLSKYEWEDTSYLINFSELCELETNDLPSNCPYRQILSADNPMIDFNSRRAPSSPPPNYIPNKTDAKMSSSQTKAIDSISIRPCINTFVYIWPRNGRGFWAYVVFVGRRSLAGYRWNGRRWFYFAIGLSNIEAFFCK